MDDLLRQLKIVHRAERGPERTIHQNLLHRATREIERARKVEDAAIALMKDIDEFGTGDPSVISESVQHLADAIDYNPRPQDDL